MPSLICPNGHVIDLSTVPVPGEYFCIETSRWDEVINAVVGAVSRATVAGQRVEEAISDALAGEGRYIYACGVCGALTSPSDETSDRGRGG